ncbi:MAG: hypothetical protein EOO09_02605 [Chitinophagaceae bacterium]|nr:MAG: hypothetical protein EOO09_02605 [Chitinophagaceae bacterium]
MKNLIVILFLAIAAPSFAADSLDTKLVQKFTIDFPKAENVKWYDNNGNMEVYYTHEGITCHIWYDAKGNVAKSIRYYTEKDLNPFVKARIQKAYAGKRIAGVTETMKAEHMYYVVSLEDETSWTIVKSDATATELSVFNEMLK